MCGSTVPLHLEKQSEMLFGKRTTKPKPLRFTKGLFGPAISQLKNSLDVVTNNEPINRKEGDTQQANLEKTNARSFRAAIQHLQGK